MKELRSVIQYVFNDTNSAESIEKIKYFAQSKATHILLNLTQFEIHGDHRSQKLEDNVEWLFRGHDGYYAYDPGKNKDNEISFYYLNPYGNRNIKIKSMSSDKKEELAKVLAKKSLPIFTLMKYYGYNITLRKCIKTDLSLSHGYGLKTLSAVSEAKERALNYDDNGKLKGQMFFYFKDRSCYHLYSVSRKWYPQIQEFLTAYGAPPKEV